MDQILVVFGLQIWGIAAKVLNMQSLTADPRTLYYVASVSLLSQKFVRSAMLLIPIVGN
jgi:hypothetical protein